MIGRGCITPPMQENIPVAAMLLAKGAEVNGREDGLIPPKRGLAPLHLAAANGSIAMAELLIVNGAKINDNGGWHYSNAALPGAAENVQKQNGGNFCWRMALTRTRARAELKERISFGTRRRSPGFGETREYVP